MIRIVAALAIMLTGCSSMPEHFSSSHPQHKTVRISWTYVDDPDETCRKLGVKTLPWPWVEVLACTVYDQPLASCTIYTGKNTNTAILGHELRHCFEGDYH